MPYVFDRGSAQHRSYRMAGFALFTVALVLAWLLLPEFQVSRLGRAAATAVAVLGLNLVVGYSGLLALCQSAFIAIGAFMSATLIMDHGWDYWMTIPIGMLVAFLVGLLLGIPALKIKGLYLAMTTVAFAAAFPSLTKLEFHLGTDLSIADRTGGANGREIAAIPNGNGDINGEKLNAPSWFPFFENEPSRYRFIFIALLAAAAFWLVGNLVKSRAGRAVISIRDNEIGAAVSGVELRRFKVLNFGISAALGGLAGVMWAMNTGFVAEQDYTFVLMVDLLVALVVGGVGTVSGAVIGALVVVFGRWLCQTYFDYSLSSIIVMGLIVAAAMYLAGRQNSFAQRALTFLGVAIAGFVAAWAIFRSVDVPGLYQLNGDGPLSQAIFGIVLIVVVFFAPQGIVGAWRKVWSRVVQIRPVAPELPANAETIRIDLTDDHAPAHA